MSVRVLINADADALNPTVHGRVPTARHFVMLAPELAVWGTRGELMGFADRFREAVLELYKFDAAGASPNARPVSPVSATVSPDGGAPGLVSTLAEGGSGGAPGAPADCAPVPAPNIDINTDPKEGEL